MLCDICLYVGIALPTLSRPPPACWPFNFSVPHFTEKFEKNKNSVHVCQPLAPVFFEQTMGLGETGGFPKGIVVLYNVVCTVKSFLR